MNTVSADNQTPIQAWFKLVPEANSLLVLPICQAENEIMIRYEINAIKNGPSGRSQNSQGGQFLLSSNKEVVLSTLQFGLSESDQYQFEMHIFVNNLPVTTAISHYP